MAFLRQMQAETVLRQPVQAAATAADGASTPEGLVRSFLAMSCCGFRASRWDGSRRPGRRCHAQPTEPDRSRRS
jgi:hypothetical protein